MDFEERLALAPMMEVTDAYYRRLLRIMTSKTVLYTEMVVDDTINHTPNIDFVIGKHPGVFPSVIQLGGSNPETLGQAAGVCGRYDSGYAELNLNCGCPSNRVAKRCFGAQLMLKPDLVREIVHTMRRTSNLPVSVKCRLGVTGERDSYEDLVEFISAANAGGATKFIVHSRDCVLAGLTTKQNRDIPPLRYEVVHRLVNDFPDLTFILNGGVATLQAAKDHFAVGSFTSKDTTGVDGEDGRTSKEKLLPPVHGVMIGRAVASEPVLFATADSEIYGCPDPCKSRRVLLDTYCDYADWVQSGEGPRRTTNDGKVQRVSTALLINAMRNVMCGLPNNRKYLRALNDIYVEEINSGTANSEYPLASDIIQRAISCISDEALDSPLRPTGMGKTMV
jgi:tRNA-dihydrouridine synthase A